MNSRRHFYQEIPRVLGALYRALGTKTKQVLLGFLCLCLGLCCVLLQLLSWRRARGCSLLQCSVGEHRLSAFGLSCATACGIFQDQELNCVPCTGRFLPTYHQGSCISFYTSLPLPSPPHRVPAFKTLPMGSLCPLWTLRADLTSDLRLGRSRRRSPALGLCLCSLSP